MRKPTGLKRLGAVSAVVGMTLAGVVLGVSPAQAAAPSDCRLGDTCLYTGYNYTNDVWQNPGKINFANCIDRLGEYFHNDYDSSVYNNGRSENSYLYKDTYAQNTRKLVLRGQGISDLGTVNFNDEASSAYFSSAISRANSQFCY